MRKIIFGCVLLLPLVAMADPPCKHSAPRDLSLDLGGIKTVLFEVGPHYLQVQASAASGNRIEGVACASDAKYLPELTLDQLKSGDRLTVRLLRNGGSGSGGIFNLFGKKHYGYMKLRASVPDDVLVELKVGSGDVGINGAREARIDIGSGDARATRIRGTLTASVGSGDLVAEDIGALQLQSVGSGDATIRTVRGATKVGSIGSGDLEITGSQGPVNIGSVGSGDVDLRDIAGDVTVGSIGSGDLDVKKIRGNLTVRSLGSGDVKHRDIEGKVDLPGKQRASQASAPQARTIHVDTSNHSLVRVEGNRVGATAADGRIAWIDSSGGLRIDDKPVALDEQQQALARRFHAEAMALQEAGRTAGLAGAAFAGKVVWSVMAGLVRGDTDLIEQRVDGQVAGLGEALLPLCQRIAALKTAQDGLSRALPAFAPYATITAAAASDCTTGIAEMSA